MTIPAILLTALGAYLACGLVFAVPFAIVGAKRVDPQATTGSWGFRLLIIPGAMTFWPFLLLRWMGGVSAPPEQRDPHRLSTTTPRAKST